MLNVFHTSFHQSIRSYTSSATGGLFVDPSLQPVLDYVGDNGDPSSAFPLGFCEGDCDRDSQCQPGLKCFQRTGTQAVPGCSGEGLSGKDYCYSVTTPSPTPLTPTGDTSYIEWNVTVPSTGMYLLSWRYALDAAVQTTNVSD